MQRFFVSPQAMQGKHVHFDAAQGRQMRLVLRLGPGDEVLALDGQGRCYRVALRELSKDAAWGEITGEVVVSGEPEGMVLLNLALIRGERFEWALQKGVELGVTHFRPLITQRTQRKAPGAQKWQRWQRIISEAAEQCGRATLPQLLPPCDFSEALANSRGPIIMPALAAAQPIAGVLPHLHWPVTLMVGPEGGFTAAEVAQAQEAGAHIATLGPRILRSETAALVLITLVLQALGVFQHPPTPLK